MLQLAKKDSGEGIVCAVSKNRIFVVLVSANVDTIQPIAPKRGCSSRSCGGSHRGGCGKCFPLVSAPNGYIGNEIGISTKDANKFNVGDHIQFTRFIPEPGLMGLLIFGVPVICALSVMLYLHVKTPRQVSITADFLYVAAALFGGFIIVGIFDYFFKKRYPSMAVKEAVDDIR